ncbi:anaerobic glycerol-3-phosphate dehydrogenase subunit B [Heliobacterium chlorum]|uniref:Anaerobic glycerol-3-phosphate dehydrogenase subunit B n=1 Tax=Heliobacterium chlorum TaxID=2698 RepID=A0ABR7T4J6_HELCL|nr:anaerobic glycerol-3-phosphate dehydrogenase subunit GlpB [Heliobacterium chlorum]MBC9785704.1 anaerobic glycerol-3-phosphate dehydrogenase subunit B [Heliobacterium chlorum]
MNKKTDVLVIGAGLSGMMAAARAAQSGKKVTLLTKGMGTLSLTSGCIDLWGYEVDNPKQPCGSPFAQIQKVVEQNPSHPYAKVYDVLKESLTFFQGICDKDGLTYRDNGGENWLLPTAVGTLRPTYLAPTSMAVKDLNKVKQIVVAGFDELKDFYPEVLVTNLKKSKLLRPDCELTVAHLKSGWKKLYATSLAHRLEQPEGQREVIRQLKPLIKPGAIVLFPPALGERRDIDVAGLISKGLGCPVYEVTNLPPALPGQRLQDLFLKYLKNQGVTVILSSTVTGAQVAGNRCSHVTAEGAGKTFTISAQTYILATGSFVGGGFDSKPGQIEETIFGLPINTGDGKWASGEFLSLKGHPFNRFGIDVNDRLQPVDGQSKVILENVLVTGANLAGSEFSIEKCGNGVALASGFKAGKLAGEVSR